MRKFAFIPFVKVVACAACLLAVQSFAQPRDLFAEFEEEAAVADSVETAKAKAAEEKAAAEKAEAEKKAAEEKAAVEKAEAEKKAAEEKAAAEKAEAEKKAAEEKAAAEKAEAEKKAAEEKAAAEKAEAEKKAAEEKAAAEKAEAEKKAAEEKAAAEKAEAEKKAALDQAAADSIAAAEAAQRAANEKKAAMARATAESAAAEAQRALAAPDSQADPYEGVDRNEAYAREMQRISDSLQYISDSIAVAQMDADSIAAVQKAAEDSAKAYADSVQMANASSSSAAIPSSSSMSRRDVLGPVKVSKVNGIDDMKGKYKSPRKAMFMSLVVPGSGQLFVGGSSFTNIRGGVYLALEAALWGGWYYFSVNKYDKQVKKYKDFAKKHYSIGRYEQGMRALYDADGGSNEYEFRTRYLGSRETFCEGIFGKALTHGCYDKTTLYHNDVQYKNDFAGDKNLGEEMKQFEFNDASVVFQQIADEAYVLGWDDVEDVAVIGSLELDDPNAATVSLGKSSRREDYRSMRSKANDYADMQAWFFGGIILNHIISAVDAAFTANAHNKILYQEDLSWYDHLHFDGGLFLGEGVGVNVQANWGF